ncbi:MAG: hypothetical protein JWM36_2461 [Hyphomicrobiales bacterium]|nr:hypothetical protein [Hyphomicrobiales bacterium]
MLRPAKRAAALQSFEGEDDRNVDPSALIASQRYRPWGSSNHWYCSSKQCCTLGSLLSIRVRDLVYAAFDAVRTRIMDTRKNGQRWSGWNRLRAARWTRGVARRQSG